MVDQAERVHADDRLDVETHERMAAGFWIAVLVVSLVVTAAADRDARIWAPGGLAFVAGYAVANVLYAVRIAFGPPRGVPERLGIAAALTGVLALQQWLAGPVPLLEVLMPLYVLGAVAVLERPQRLLYLPVVACVALSPLAYEAVTVPLVLTQMGLLLVLVLEMGLLAEYGDRVRQQRGQLAQAERDARHRSVTDELTGLANRRALQARLAAQDPGAVTVVYCDLDGFKPFNDRFGHAAGDALLQRLGARLRGAVDGHGEAFRVGGDEFCAFVDGDHAEPDAPAVQQVVDALAETGVGYDVACSHGIGRTPVDAVDLTGAMRVADRRMYAVKAQHRAQRPPDGAGGLRSVDAG